MYNNNCFSNAISYVFPSWHSDQQIGKNACFHRDVHTTRILIDNVIEKKHSEFSEIWFSTHI